MLFVTTISFIIVVDLVARLLVTSLHLLHTTIVINVVLFCLILVILQIVLMILTSPTCPLRSLTSVMNFPLPGTMRVCLAHPLTIRS